MWRCNCGSPQPDSKGYCHACGTSRGMGSAAQAYRGPAEVQTPIQTYSKPRSKSDWLWPKITGLESAKRAARQGVWAAMITVVTTSVVVVLAHAGFPIADLGVEALVDAALFLIVAWGIHKMSRTAAVGGLSLYLLEQIYMWSQDGPRGLPLVGILALMYINAIRGTFQYHKILESRLNIRNVFILNALGLLYSSAVFVMSVVVLVIAALAGVDIKAIDDQWLGYVIISGMVIAYVVTLLRMMPFTKTREMFKRGDAMG